MSIFKTDSDWIKIGKLNPYHGVLSNPEYSLEVLNEAKLDSFFKSGQIWVEHIFKMINSHFNAPPPPKKALDFGCGVGRITIPLSKIAKEVIGMDISPNMIKLAEKHGEELQNIRYVISDDDFSKISEDTFDFVHTYIVLQHIPVSRGEVIIKNLLNKLESNGIGVIHFTFYNMLPHKTKFFRFQRKYSFLNYLGNILKSKKINEPFRQMNIYNVNKIFKIFFENGIENLFLEFTNHGGFYGIVVYFQKK